MGLAIPAYLTLRLDIHYILDERVLLSTSDMVDSALKPDRVDRYFILTSGHLFVALLLSLFGLILYTARYLYRLSTRCFSSHAEHTSYCDRNDVRIPSPRSTTQNGTLATASCLSYNASIGPVSCPCSWYYELLANIRSDLRNTLPGHVNFLFRTHDASPTPFRQATFDATHIFRLERVL